MPTLDWIGKQAVVRHHADVPFHLLKEEPELSCGGEAGAGNLIVQGDNLKALKALLPHYGGQVKCIYIDPPYNTGNEGWVYNDNVNSPEINRWMESVVGKEGEDQTRHDKWLCMMYPRLMLLKRFLREDGSIWISIDDNEVASLRLIMDEIFGKQNFLGQAIWQKKYSPQNDAKRLSEIHEYVVVYARAGMNWTLNLLERTEEGKARYKNPDNDPRGVWKAGDFTSKTKAAGHSYRIVSPSGKEFLPTAGRQWAASFSTYERLISEKRVWFGPKGESVPALKQFLTEVQAGTVPTTLWLRDLVGDNQEASREIAGLGFEFDSPKPTRLIERIIHIATNPGDLILDSFAGSGTTGHAVLKQNAEDGGNRRFILVEMDENIAQNITAERVRRVSQGYTNAKGEAVPGLGSGFRFATLGKTLFDEAGAIREDVKFRELAEFVYFHHTGSPMPPKWKKSPLLGIVDGRAIYLLYNGILSDKSVDGGNVLTAPVLAELPPHAGSKTIYAAACRLGANRLVRERIQFKQTPYGLRVD